VCLFGVFPSGHDWAAKAGCATGAEKHGPSIAAILHSESVYPMLPSPIRLSAATTILSAAE
jgi:hypothetical protein